MTDPQPGALRLLAVLAHPDDETLGMGGTLARCAAEGIETHLVTATRGEGGRYLGARDGPGHPGRERLAEIREAELRAATDVLGVREVTILGYPDGGLDRVDPTEASARIAAAIRRVRPQVVVTFAPDGAYGHPDHIAISQLASAALVVAADAARADGAPPHAVSKLYYMVSPASSWALYQRAFKRLTSTVDGVVREAIPWPDWAITTVIDTRAHWRTVWRAVQRHHSQTAGYATLAALPDEEREALWSAEWYYRALSTVNGGRATESDLFAGLRDPTD